MASLSTNIRVRLSIMMFLQYAIYGIWIVPIGAYLGKIGYSGVEIAAVAGTSFAIAAMIAPIFVGMLVDRFFSGQKVLAVLNLLAAVFLYLASQSAIDGDGKIQANLMFWLVLFHFLFYMPTWPLTNSIALYQMDNPGKQFPSIRVMGTLGFISVSTICLFGDKVTSLFSMTEKFEETVIPMYIGSAICLVSAVLALSMPKTPPKETTEKVTVSDLLGLKAIALFKDSQYLIFAISTFLIMFSAIFFWIFCNLFLNEVGMEYAQFKMSLGQMSEVIFMLLIPFFFKRFGVKIMLLIGMLTWAVRFLCFALGNVESLEIVLLIGLALHGVCYDFFFVTGQLYTDKKAPKAIQAQAQGLISFVTFGLGWFFACLVAGKVVDHFAVKEMVDGVETITGHDWQAIWKVPVAFAIIVAIFFGIFFNDKTVVGRDEN